MKKIIYTTLASALVVLAVANAASAAERHHARRQVQQPTVGTNVDPRDSYAAFGFRGPGYDGGNNARIYGGALSAPAGR